MTGVQFLGPSDANVAWDGARLCEPNVFEPGALELRELRGALASVVGDETTGWRCVRDPLGINKLFWTRDADGTLLFAARPRTLIDVGRPLADIRSVPPGALVDLDPAGAPVSSQSLVPERWFAATDEHTSIEATSANIRTTIERYLSALAEQLCPREVYLCLSGGLDSSGIAALAREVFPSAVAVSFDLKRQGSSPSDDRIAAIRVARDLRLPLFEVSVTEDELLEHLDTVLVEGVDFRDFNVHAALVNAAMAAGMAGAGADPSAVVLTGDLANEFLVDYHAEIYRGATYYRLPRLRPGALRSWLVKGLDSCHREVGVFSAYGMRVVQPYAVAVDDYLSLPERFLTDGNRKTALDRLVFGDRVPEHVYARKKVRAQVGSDEVGGVLGACLDRGIDQRWLRRRFATLHDVEDEAVLDRFVRAGRFASRVPNVEER